MSGLEIYGALATTAGLVKVANQVRKYCKERAERLEALEQARVAGIHQLTSLRTVFKSFASSFDTYNDTVIDFLPPKAKEAIGEIMKDMIKTMETSEGTVSKLRALTKTKFRSKSELDVLREELAADITALECLQGSFNAHIQFETFRRVSPGNPEHEPHDSKKPPNRQDSEPESITPASRQNTNDSTWSTPTLTSAFPPKSVYPPGSSSGSKAGSTDSSSAITLVESKQLRAAVDEKDCRRIEQLIREKTTECEKESWKLSALFLACSRRKKSIVQFLLSLNPNVHAINESGLGIMHATIGHSEHLCEVKEQDTADILKLLEDHHPHLIRSTDKEKRQPLHYCAMTGNCRAAQYILNVDPGRVNATDSKRKTPLYHVCEHHSPNKRLLKLLLQNGGDFGTRNRPKMKEIRLAPIKKILDDEEKTRSLTFVSS